MARTKTRKAAEKKTPDPVPTRRSGLAWVQRLLIYVFLATAVPVLVLRWVPPPTSMFMVIQQASALAGGNWHYRVRYHWTPWQSISPQMKLAVVASEDQTFAQHPGFDFKAMTRALEKNRTTRRIRGGSTITQQTAKNLFLFPGKSYFRKVFEAYFTLLIELSWPKDRILEVYLNIAEFGDGIYGVGAASPIFFHKPASRLDGHDAALMAAVLPNPKILRVDLPSEYVHKRQSWILEQMDYLRGRHYLDLL